MGAPVIGLNDSGGARIQEGVMSLAGYADIFLRNTLYSGVVPQISAIMGPCAGGAVYSPGHHRLHPDGGQDLVHVHHRSGRDQDRDPRGSHQGTTGRRDDAQRDLRRGAFLAHDDAECLSMVRELLSFIPSNNLEDPPRKACTDPCDRADAALDTMVPAAIEPALRHQGCDPRGRRRWIFLRSAGALCEEYRGGIRAAGRAIRSGIVANQPAFLAGTLDINASIKGARFVRFCDCFNIPLVTFEDVPGFLPGTKQEYGGIIKHGAKLLFAFAEATVPKVR